MSVIGATKLKVVGGRVTVEQRRAVEQVADELGCTVSDVTRAALVRFLEVRPDVARHYVSMAQGGRTKAPDGRRPGAGGDV